MATVGFAITNGTQGTGLAGELQARFHDPLWTLGRQWQLGEFRGEDCGSPTAVHVELEEVAVNGYRPGGHTNFTDYAPALLPLETMVERETADPERAVSWREAAETGQHLLRLLNGLGAAPGRSTDPLLRAYGLKAPDPAVLDTLDADSRRMMAVLAGRVVDGALLRQDIQATSIAAVIEKLAAAGLASPVTGADAALLTQGLTDWLRWCENRVSRSAPEQDAWQPERMEYRFDLAVRTATGTLELKAEEYYSGELDWYAVDMEPPAGPQAQLAPALRKLDLLPAPVSYHGMPLARFWEMEDARINFAAVEAAPNDLPRRLLLKFALEFSNDWFVVPVELPVGSLSRVRRLVVSNSFGERHLISPAAETDQARGRWRAFSISGDDQNWFYLAAALAKGLQGKALEEIWLQRDEGANLGWAVQTQMPSLAGGTLNRSELSDSSAEEILPAPREGTRAYRLGTRVPAYWKPLLPARLDSGMRLRQARLQTAGDDLPTIMRLDQLMPMGRDLDLYDEEVPAEGVQVTRAYQYARWCDGSTHLWIGRQKRPGRGDAASGLVFDLLELGGGTNRPRP